MAAPALFAQSPSSTLPEFSAGRPGFAESVDVVGRGVVQLELGAALERDRAEAGRSTGVSVPTPLLRVGLTERLELQLGADGYRWRSRTAAGTPARESGHSDVAAGLKARLTDQERSFFALALLGGVSLPAGAHAFTSSTVDPFVKLAWSRSLPVGLQAAGDAGVTWPTDNGRRAGERAISVAVSRESAGFAPFVEAFAVTAAQPAGGMAWSVGSGVARVVRGSWQLDVSGGKGVSPAAPDWFVSCGIAVRHAGWRAR